MSLRNVLILGMVFLAGCSLPFGKPPERKYFVLKADEHHSTGTSTVFPTEIPRETRVVVRDAAAARFVNSQRILFSDSNLQRGFYQYASWADTPPKLFTSILVQKLEESGAYTSVSRQSTAARADYQINTHLQDFYQDLSVDPYQVKLVLDVELLRLADRTVVNRSTVTKSAAVKDDDVVAAVDGFNIIVNEAAESVAAWVYENIPKTTAPETQPETQPETKPETQLDAQVPEVLAPEITAPGVSAP